MGDCLMPIKPPPDKEDAEPFVLPPVNDGKKKPKAPEFVPQLPPDAHDVAKSTK
jgi:hypothetical protein